MQVISRDQIGKQCLEPFARTAGVLCVPRGARGEGSGRVGSICPHPQWCFCWPFRGVASAVVCRFCRYVSLRVCLGVVFVLDGHLAIFFFFFLEEAVLLAFSLWCFDCCAVTLTASFFPFGVLERKVLGNCICS